MLKQFVAAVQGGILIAIGGCVYLNAVGTLNKNIYLGTVVGAFFFSVALICICFKGYGLFTGRVGYLPERFGSAELAGLSMTLLGNAVATLGIGSLVFLTMEGTLGTVALAAVAAKLGAPWYLNLLRAILCGALMYLAVSIYREKNTALGIVFCVPAFILAGFEHSIADMFYVAASGHLAWDSIAFLLLVIVGNAIGGMLLPLLSMLGQEPPAPADGTPTDEAPAACEVEE